MKTDMSEVPISLVVRNVKIILFYLFIQENYETCINTMLDKRTFV